MLSIRSTRKHHGVKTFFLGPLLGSILEEFFDRLDAMSTRSSVLVFADIIGEAKIGAFASVAADRAAETSTTVYLVSRIEMSRTEVDSLYILPSYET